MSDATRMAMLVAGRAAMRTLLIALRDGHIKGKDIAPAIEALIGPGNDLTDDIPEAAALEERRRLVADVQAWREACYRASRDADAMSLIIRSLAIDNGAITNNAEIAITPELWAEIQDAVGRSQQRIAVDEKFAYGETLTAEGSARSDS